VPLEEPGDQGVTWVGFPLEVIRVLESVYLDQAERDFASYIRETLAASQRYGGRYNPTCEFGAIYTASDEETAWQEVAARYEREGVHGLPPTMGFVGILVRAGRYVDLNDVKTRQAWDADAGALRAIAPTQTEAENCWAIGRAVRAVADFLMAPSARGTGANIPLFTDRENSELVYTLQSIQRGRIPSEFAQRPTEAW
jgi:RES domain-containing protein